MEVQTHELQLGILMDTGLVARSSRWDIEQNSEIRVRFSEAR